MTSAATTPARPKAIAENELRDPPATNPMINGRAMSLSPWKASPTAAATCSRRSPSLIVGGADEAGEPVADVRRVELGERRDLGGARGGVHDDGRDAGDLRRQRPLDVHVLDPRDGHDRSQLGDRPTPEVELLVVH